MIRLLFIIGSVILVTGCSSIIKVELVNVEIVTTTLKEIGRGKSGTKVNENINAIKFDIISKEEVHNYFIIKNRTPINVVCRADGASREGEFESFGYGPFYEDQDISILFGPKANDVNIEPNTKSGKYKYTVYSFLDLEAGYTQLHYGVPETALDLKHEQFHELSCIISGFTYPPLVPPRSSEFGISHEKFLRILEKHHAEVMN